MSEVLKGAFRVEVEAGTDIGREILTMRPKDIQIINTLINKHSGEEVQFVYVYNNPYAYKVHMEYEKFAKLANGVED